MSLARVGSPTKLRKRPGLLVLCSNARLEGNFPAANNLSGNLTSGHGWSFETREL